MLTSWRHLPLIPLLLLAGSCAPTPPVSSQPSPYGLPLGTIFKGERQFHAIVRKAEAGNWRALPLGERTMRVAAEMLGTPYVNFTLEVDDRIEAPVVNFTGLDCWTFYENALAIARMIHHYPRPHSPAQMLRMVELERYRHGKCTGSYLSRMHHLEEVFADNQRRGLAVNITRQLPGAVRLRREVREMTIMWKSYRYLRANPSLLQPMARIEQQVSNLPVYHVPKSRVRAVEQHLRDGDICAITSNGKYGYTSHVGLILKRNGRAHFVHATSDRDKGRKVIIDRPITTYVNELSKHAGIIICRPRDLPPLQEDSALSARREDRILNRR